MARVGLHQHRKFLRLAIRLESAPLARGVLEMLWEPAYDGGDDFLGDAQDIEARCGWVGPAGFLATALVESGFVDPIEDQPGRFSIHDLFDHMPNQVANRIHKELQRQARGKTLHDVRKDAGRLGGLAKASKRLALASEPLAKVPTPPPPPPLLEAFAGSAALELDLRPAKKAKEPKPPPDPRHTPLKAELHSAFQAITGVGYGWQGGKDGKGLSALLALCPDDEEILLRWSIAWQRTGFERPKDIQDFVSKWNLYALPQNRRQVDPIRADPNGGIMRGGP